MATMVTNMVVVVVVVDPGVTLGAMLVATYGCNSSNSAVRYKIMCEGRLHKKAKTQNKPIKAAATYMNQKQRKALCWRRRSLY